MAEWNVLMVCECRIGAASSTYGTGKQTGAGQGGVMICTRTTYCCTVRTSQASHVTLVWMSECRQADGLVFFFFFFFFLESVLLSNRDPNYLIRA